MKKELFVSKVKQRDDSEINFTVFVASSKDIKKWTGITRVGEEEKGHQRVLKETRLKAIEKFIKSDINNTIPTSIILAFQPGTTNYVSLSQSLNDCLDQNLNNEIENKIDYGILTFDYDENDEEKNMPAFVVDGQHRLMGLAELEEDIPVLVVAILDATPEEQAFQFIVINNKSAKVKTDNVKAIIADFDEDELQERLKKARVNYKDIPATLLDIDKSDESPFKDLLDWPLNQTEEKEIKLTTIEACLRYTRNQIPGLKEEDDEDSTKYIFMAIWRAVKENFPALWRTNERFMSKVNINALNEYVIDRLENIYVMSNFDIFDEAKVEIYTKKILAPINIDYWESDWVIKIQDNAVVRNTIKKDLKIMSHNNASGRKEWYENLEAISLDIGLSD